jgi:hypothetical protein
MTFLGAGAVGFAAPTPENIDRPPPKFPHLLKLRQQFLPALPKLSFDFFHGPSYLLL